MLRILGKDAAPFDAYASEVLSGDSSNREAVAASFYFRQLIEEGTRRESDYTATLDYGYAILRPGVARALVSGGWLVSVGIHHNNDLNAFNLVDDFIEPFRPVVDLLIFKCSIAHLTPESKHMLAMLFEMQVICNEEKMTLQQAITEMTQSFKQAVLEKSPERLLLPEIGDYSLTRID